MVDLFKKRQGSTPKNSKPTKKPLFAKKKATPEELPPADHMADLADESPDTQPSEPVASPKRPKKLGKSLGAKKVSKPDAGASNDDKLKKIIRILVALFALAVLGLAAAFFLAEDEPVEPAPAVTNPAPSPEPATPPAPEAATPEASTSEPVAPVAQEATTQAPTNEPAPAATQDTEDTANNAEATNTAASQPVSPTRSRTISHEEFLRETENRVYREHDTTPP